MSNNIIEDLQLRLNKPTKGLLLDLFARHARIPKTPLMAGGLILSAFPDRRIMTLEDINRILVGIRTRKKFAYICKESPNEQFAKTKSSLVKKLQESLIDYEYVPAHHMKRIVREL